jgi:formate/nitrite transporter FocA (FNT family)
MKDIIYDIKCNWSASLFIAIGCVANLLIEQPYGAILFSFGLLMVCYYKSYLFTGKCGYLRFDTLLNFEQDFVIILYIFIQNWTGAIFFGGILGFSIPAIQVSAMAKVQVLNSTPIHTLFLEAIFCGIIIYLTVELFRVERNPIGILIGVPLFILAGFQHSIANMIYYAMSGDWSISVPLVCGCGNWIGAVFARWITNTK